MDKRETTRERIERKEAMLMRIEHWIEAGFGERDMARGLRV